MATPVEQLQKQIAELSAKKTHFEKKLVDAQQRQAEIRSKRNSLLAKIAEGDTSASKTLHSLDTETHESLQHVEAFELAIKEAAARLDTLRNDLRRAEREAEIDALDALVAGLVPASNKLEEALAAVREQSDELFAATKAVAVRLRGMDEERFGGSYEYTLTAVIRESIWHRIEEFGVQSKSEPRPTFFERVKVRLTGAVANLRYLNLEGHVVAGKSEKLYTTLISTGARGVSLRRGTLSP